MRKSLANGPDERYKSARKKLHAFVGMAAPKAVVSRADFGRSNPTERERANDPFPRGGLVHGTQDRPNTVLDLTGHAERSFRPQSHRYR